MKCPDKQTLQKLLDGELPESKVAEVIGHIRSCETCKAELEELCSLQDTLSILADEDKCPALDELMEYADGKCSGEQATQMAEHVDFCGKCRSLVWALQASEQELADWQTKEQQAYLEFEAGELGYDAAKEIFAKLLPGGISLLDNIWQSVMDFVTDMKNKAVESWPAFNHETCLAGVLGFAESDPQAQAASIIATTTLYVSQAVTDGKLSPTTEDIEAAAKQISAKLGAGKELQKRLAETLPSLILNFHKEQ